jgi:transcriptional regulator with XRE-family HTH domain
MAVTHSNSGDKISSDNTFGQLLKRWRSQRNFSQLDLSMASDVSQRHISFMESGRARPSRDMVIKLSLVLDIPLRQQNEMLTTAGFAPIYSEFDLTAPELAPIRRALDCMLRQQEPYPALVMDRYWNQVTTNQGAAKLLGWLLAGHAVPAEICQNLMKLTLHPKGIKSYVANWNEIAQRLLHRIHRESLAEGPNTQAQTLFNEVLAYPGIQALWHAPTPENWHLPLLSITFKKESTQFTFFTTLTTLGTPQDITLQELRLECLFPADDATEKHFKNLNPREPIS